MTNDGRAPIVSEKRTEENCDDDVKSAVECSETESASNTAATNSSDEAKPEPARPPRSKDDGVHSMPSYCNLPSSEADPEDPPPPTIPKRQPHMRRATSPMIVKRKHKPEPLPPPPPPPPPNPDLPQSHYVNKPPNSASTVASSSCSSANMYENSRAIGDFEHLHKEDFSTRTRSQRRRRNASSASSSCLCRSASMREFDGDIVSGQESTVSLVYSRYCSGAMEWAKYLHKLYSELSKHKGKLRVRHLPVEDLAGNALPQRMQQEIYESRLQLVLLSPNFLQFLFKNPSFVLGKLLHPDRVLAVMLGVKDNQIMPEHRAGLVSFSQWIHLEAKDHDLEFVQTVLYFSTQILNRSDLRRSRKMSSMTTSSTSTMPRSHHLRSSMKAPENGAFHIHPKKLTENHRRLVIIFETAQCPHAQFRLRLERQHAGLHNVDLREWKLINPYNIQVTVPSSCFSVTNLASLRIDVDGVDRGTRIVKLESALSELDALLKNALDPMDFMCQTLGITGKEHLDRILTKTMLDKIPSKGFAHLKLAKESMASMILNRDQGEFPTLLHFSAFHGLSNLTNVLLECPGFNVANDIKNASGLTPPELAQMNGHGDLADTLFNHQSRTKFPHFYKNIPAEVETTTLVDKSTTAGVSVLQQRKARATSEYQVPPPPRPVENIQTLAPYLDMSGSNSASPTPSPKQNRRPHSLGRISQTLKFKSRKEEVKPAKPESPEYAEIKSPPRRVLNQKDPFGTLRASKRSNSGREDALKMDDDDVFLPAANSSFNNNNLDKFGTMRASRSMNGKVNKSAVDYREKNGEETAAVGYENELAITNELLQLLEDFKTKSYSVKEMETMFDHWRRKAAVYDVPRRSKSSEFEELKEKLKRYKNNSTLLKIFQNFSGQKTSEDPNVKSTPNTKAFKRNSLIGEVEESVAQAPNETIVEAELSVINEADMSVIVVPPSPQKSPDNEGLSTQILPLSRLSLSSNGSPTNPSSQEASSSSSSSSDTSTDKPGVTSPMREKLQKLRKSLAEPLFQYFHDLQVSPESEEPDILSTPRSVASVTRNNSNATESPKLAGIKSLKSRKLFNAKDDDSSEGYENMPPIIITDM